VRESSSGTASRTAGSGSSQPRLLLLSKFLAPADAANFDKDYWAAALGEPARSAIEALQADGLLEPAPLVDALASCHRAPELKELARARGLKVSGTKSELSQRLATADADGMTRLLDGRWFLACSARGRTVAGEWVERTALARSAAENQVLGLVRGLRFDRAAKTVAQFEAGQVFPRGLGIDWSQGDDPAGNVAELEAIFGGVPKILSRASPGELEALRVAAAASLLWGDANEARWLPEGFATATGLEPDVAVRMFICYASHKRNVERMRGVVRTVKVSTVSDHATCDACRKLNGRTFTLAQVPELPHAACTSATGCRCLVVAEEFGS